jgi:hypothetical protein
MADIINLADHRPHGAGEAVCSHCKHVWEAVAPIGATQLECPECHTLKGLWKAPFAVAEGDLLYVCNCGGDLFFILPDGYHMCRECGVVGDDCGDE